VHFCIPEFSAPLGRQPIAELFAEEAESPETGSSRLEMYTRRAASRSRLHKKAASAFIAVLGGGKCA